MSRPAILPYLALGALLGGVMLPMTVSAQEEAILTRSLTTMGNTARLQRVLAQARRGEPVSVAVIGGSITQGAKASTPDKRWGETVGQWWRTTFPQARISFHNAGIGATGSIYAALRAPRDLLAHHPDLVVIEFAVNDPNTEAAAETLEGLVRQALTQPNQPAVMFIYTMHRQGNNAQEWQGKLAAHYGLPAVSFRDALWPEIEAGRMKWEDVEADEVHPNDRGHAYMAQFVTSLIAKVLADLPADDKLPAPPAVPAPLLSDRYARTAIFEGEDLQPTRNEGWTYDAAHGWDACWKSSTPGSVIEFEVEGRVVCFMEWHLRAPMGKARVQVDDSPPLDIDAWFDQTWGGWRCVHELALELPAGKHRVRVELLQEKNPQSEGHEFRIMGLGAAGL